MRYYIIAGEASGDLHASNLIRGLRAEDPEADIRGWGGDLMREAGAEIVRHYNDTAIMGFLTVLKYLGKIKANIRLCCEDIRSWKPDVVILVDYAGFNLRIARFAKGIGLKVFYYISPKLWAWNTGRVKRSSGMSTGCIRFFLLKRIFTGAIIIRWNTEVIRWWMRSMPGLTGRRLLPGL